MEIMDNEKAMRPIIRFFIFGIAIFFAFANISHAAAITFNGLTSTSGNLLTGPAGYSEYICVSGDINTLII